MINIESNNGETMEPEVIMSHISKEILVTLKAMKKAKTAEDRLMHSKTVKNLCESLGVFFGFMSEMDFYGDEDMDEEGYEDDSDGGIPF